MVDDGIAIYQGHTFRIVVSHPDRNRRIWFGSKPLGREHEPVLCLARQARELAHPACGHGHVEAIPLGNSRAYAASRDFVRQVPCHNHPASRRGLGCGAQSEYVRVAGRDRYYIKGQKYTLPSRLENLTLGGKKALRLRLASA
jgi:hypothetical protein